MKDAPMLLLDTNIWLDAYDGERVGSIRARALLSRAVERGATIAFAVCTLKDVYCFLGSAAKRRTRIAVGELTEASARAAEEIAWACVENMQELATPVAVDMSDVWLAGKYRELHRDFEDALIAAAATRCKADVLVTNDERFLRHCPVRAMDSADALTWLSLQAG